MRPKKPGKKDLDSELNFILIFSFYILWIERRGAYPLSHIPNPLLFFETGSR